MIAQETSTFESEMYKIACNAVHRLISSEIKKKYRKTDEEIIIVQG